VLERILLQSVDYFGLQDTIYNSDSALSILILDHDLISAKLVMHIN